MAEKDYGFPETAGDDEQSIMTVRPRNEVACFGIIVRLDRNRD